MRITLATFGAGLCAMFALSSWGSAADTPSPLATTTLKILHFNAGNGDSTLIVVEGPTSPGKNAELIGAALIDGGSHEMAGKVVIPGLKQSHISKLKYVIATNYDRKHREGLEDVVRTMEIDVDGGAYDRDRAWPSRKDGGWVPNRPLQAGEKLKIGDVSIECVVANGNTATWTGAKPAPDEISQSVGLKITFGNFHYFTGGDLTGGGARGWWGTTPDMETPAARDIGQVEVLRVNHHGSDTSSNQVFLATLNPLVAIISTGRDPENVELFHWPSRKVLDRLTRLPGLKAVYVTGEVATPKGLNDEDKKKVKNNQGTVTVSATADGAFQVNGTSYQASK